MSFVANNNIEKEGNKNIKYGSGKQVFIQRNNAYNYVRNNNVTLLLDIMLFLF